MAVSSEAYDFSLFDTRYDNTMPAELPKEQPKREVHHRDNVVELPREHTEQKQKQKVKRHPIRMMAASLVFFTFVALGAAMVYSQQQLAVLTEQINLANETLAESQSLEVQLNMRASQTMSASQVEEYAEQLGMSKVNSGQITYVNVARQDKGTVLESAGETSVLDWLLGKIKSLFA